MIKATNVRKNKINNKLGSNLAHNEHSIFMILCPDNWNLYFNLKCSILTTFSSFYSFQVSLCALLLLLTFIRARDKESAIQNCPPTFLWLQCNFFHFGYFFKLEITVSHQILSNVWNIPPQSNFKMCSDISLVVVKCFPHSDKLGNGWLWFEVN